MDLSLIRSFNVRTSTYGTRMPKKESMYDKINNPYNQKPNTPLFEGLTPEQNEEVCKAWEDFNNPDIDSEYTGTQKWYKFLSELEKNGLITSEERSLASGEGVVVPVNEKGEFQSCRTLTPEELEAYMFKQDEDPVKWLDYFIFTQSKVSQIAKIDGFNTSGVDEQIAACKKVQNIINILNK